MTIELRGHHLRLLKGYLRYFGKPLEYLEKKRKRIIDTAVSDGHSREHGENIVSVLEGILELEPKIKLVDGIDDICATCNMKNERKCKKFILYGISAASDDRAAINYLGLQKREYTTKLLIEKLKGAKEGF